MNVVAKLSDEGLAQELRDRGLVGPIDSRFLADYRADREFAEAVQELNRLPDGPERFRRALIRAGLLPTTDLGDERLLSAWKRWRDARRAYEASGPDADDAADAPWLAQMAVADEVINLAPATTVEGALVKMRRALEATTTDSRVGRALNHGDDFALYGISDELDYEARLMVDAIAALAGLHRTDSGSAAWDAAEAKIADLERQIDECGDDDEVTDRLSDLHARAMHELLKLPARTCAEAVRKLEVALLDGPLSSVDHVALFAEAKRIAGSCGHKASRA